MPTIHGILTSTGTLIGNLNRSASTSDYEALSNLPRINDVLVIGNKPLSAYDIQPTNDYATAEDIDHLFN